MQKFKSATTLDLSQGYYSIPIDKASQMACTTTLPWASYSYQRLPMGVASAPDLFQSIMYGLLGHLDHVLCYLDDIAIIQRHGETTEEHLRKVEEVIDILEKKGFRCNLRKSFFMQEEISYLGFLLTKEGIKCQPDKIQAMKRVQPPKKKKQLKSFLGKVNFYRDVFEKRSHTLKPLYTLLKGKKKDFVWLEEHQKSFLEAKEMLSEEAMLTYPDFTKEFHVYSDASLRQLGATVIQEGKPLGFYTRKLNDAQKNYTTGERELLGIIEGLKAFEGILRGQRIVFHTDHLNLLYRKLPSQRLIRWRLLLEEFSPQVKHVKGEDNDAADALSRLEMSEDEYDTINNHDYNQPLEYCDVMEKFMMLRIDKEESFTSVSHAEFLDSAFPLKPLMLATEQTRDEELQEDFQNNIDEYTVKTVQGSELIHYDNRIYVPDVCVRGVIKWYHQMLVHPGSVRLIQTIKSLFYWPNLKRTIEDYCKKCKICQMCKKQKKKYGKLPAKRAEETKWRCVNCNFYGPATVRNKNKTKAIQLLCMTMIDPVTSWFEVAVIKGRPTALKAQRILDSYWLSRYPMPEEIGVDGGPEFQAEFRELCENVGLKYKPSGAYNPPV